MSTPRTRVRWGWPCSSWLRLLRKNALHLPARARFIYSRRLEDKWLGTFIHSPSHGKEDVSALSYLHYFCPAVVVASMGSDDRDGQERPCDDCLKYVVTRHSQRANFPAMD